VPSQISCLLFVFVRVQSLWIKSPVQCMIISSALVCVYVEIWEHNAIFEVAKIKHNKTFIVSKQEISIVLQKWRIQGSLRMELEENQLR